MDNTSPADANSADAAVVPGLQGDSGAPATQGSCRAIVAQAEPARAKLAEAQADDAMSSGAASYTAAQLYQDFGGLCGSCHGATPLAGNKLSITNAVAFQNLLTESSLERMVTDDPELVMPYGGKLLSERKPNESVVLFQKRIEAWLAEDKPDSFSDPVVSEQGVARASFALTRELGETLTNMGSCVPDKALLFSEPAKMDSLDQTFAGLKGFDDLPRKLSQTDLFTLDNQALAKQGVLSYAPTYPLWSDDAHKMRYIRVPRGKSVAFSAESQSFDIPDNTRFYKTFLKEVTDIDGNVGYRKIETRLIVVRRNGEREDGLPDVKSLYATYAWNENETEAELVTDSYRDGTPFRDRVVLYTVNEQIEQPLLEMNDPDLEAQLFEQGARRHYAIPGGDRCVQCHMGGPDRSFILAFNPLQIMRRPMGEGGVLEAAGADELNQLQRFIDYGLITGIKSPDEVVPLEKSQGERLPRTPQELVAQGYMVGNCAHCHNPDGYPTRTAPALRGVLDFMPSADGGGIFEFPLDKTSPRIQRHSSASSEPVEMPYITPSLYDLGSSQGVVPYDYVSQPELVQLLAAPWRSLIYRNVDSPFTYSDGDAIYPHMPMNTAGFDCRAPRIMGEWMVSIPALPIGGAAPAADYSAQPLREVTPGDPQFSDAQLAATVRLQNYTTGNRYRYCPDTSDIIDPLKPEPSVINNKPPYSLYGIPRLAHWVETDLSPDPRWLPRNPAWREVLVDQNYDSIMSGVGDFDALQRKVEYQSKLVPLLKSMTLSEELTSFALEEVPFGLWKENDACSYPEVPQVSSFEPDLNWSWMEKPVVRNKPEAHVYMQSPGAAIFGMVCINCHGSGLDAKGRQADTVALLSGGKVRVANFREGLFGPLDDPRANREAQLAVDDGSDSSVDDWAARYMVWMALGGTTAKIPTAVLDVVGSNPVLGVSLSRNVSATPNMLELAKTTCALLLPSLSTVDGTVLPLDLASRAIRLPQRAFTNDNGDSDLWKRVCTFQNQAPIRVLVLGDPENPKSELEGLQVGRTLLRRKTKSGRDVYPAGAPVLDESGTIHLGVSDDNRFPMCVGRYASAAANQLIERLVAEEAAKSGRPPLPFCPPELFTAAGQPIEAFTTDEEFDWVHRGAIHAGFSVYTFIDAVTSGNTDVRVKPEYDQCEKLEMSAP